MSIMSYSLKLSLFPDALKTLVLSSLINNFPLATDVADAITLLNYRKLGLETVVVESSMIIDQKEVYRKPRRLGLLLLFLQKFNGTADRISIILRVASLVDRILSVPFITRVFGIPVPGQLVDG